MNTSNRLYITLPLASLAELADQDAPFQPKPGDVIMTRLEVLAVTADRVQLQVEAVQDESDDWTPGKGGAAAEQAALLRARAEAADRTGQSQY